MRAVLMFKVARQFPEAVFEDIGGPKRNRTGVFLFTSRFKVARQFPEAVFEDIGGPKRNRTGVFLFTSLTSFC